MHDSDIIKKGDERIKELLELLKIKGKVKTSMEVDEVDQRYLKILIEGDNLGYLIGYRGKNLNALQFLFGQILSQEINELIKVQIDVNDYRQRRKEYLKSLAYRAVKEAKESGQDTELPPLSPFERRIVHMTLKDEEGIKTESEGVGEDRHIVIKITKTEKTKK
jgi:spoIIIJ-associated protein